MTDEQQSIELTQQLQAQLAAEKIELPSGWSPSVYYHTMPDNRELYPYLFRTQASFSSPLADLFDKSIKTKRCNDETPKFTRKQLKALTLRIEKNEQQCRDIVLLDKILSVTDSYPMAYRVYIINGVAEYVDHIQDTHSINIDAIALAWLEYHGFSYREFIKAIRPLYRLDAPHRPRCVYSTPEEIVRSLTATYTNISWAKINELHLEGLFSDRPMPDYIGDIDPSNPLMRLPPFVFRFMGATTFELEFLMGDWHYLRDKRKPDPYLVDMNGEVVINETTKSSLVGRPISQIFGSDPESTFINKVFPENVTITKIHGTVFSEDVMHQVNMTPVYRQISRMD